MTSIRQWQARLDKALEKWGNSTNCVGCDEYPIFACDAQESLLNALYPIIEQAKKKGVIVVLTEHGLEAAYDD